MFFSHGLVQVRVVLRVRSLKVQPVRCRVWGFMWGFGGFRVTALGVGVRGTGLNFLIN